MKRAAAFAAALVPLDALAITAFPPWFWFYLLNLFVLLPLAAAIGAGSLLAVVTSPTPLLDGYTWPLIYLALVPLIAVWLAAKAKSTDATDRR